MLNRGQLTGGHWLYVCLTYGLQQQDSLLQNRHLHQGMLMLWADLHVVLCSLCPLLKLNSTVTQLQDLAYNLAGILVSYAFAQVPIVHLTLPLRL
jgi:hypothetical protein